MELTRSTLLCSLIGPVVLHASDSVTTFETKRLTFCLHWSTWPIVNSSTIATPFGFSKMRERNRPHIVRSQLGTGCSGELPNSAMSDSMALGRSDRSNSHMNMRAHLSLSSLFSPACFFACCSMFPGVMGKVDVCEADGSLEAAGCWNAEAGA